MEKKINFESSDFRFISRPDEYFIEGQVTCEGDFTDWKPEKKIEDGWGMFRGMTMTSFKGYIGELPRLDGDTASFGEFDIYYKNVIVNQFTYEELSRLVESEIRDNKINQTLYFE